MEVSEAQRVMEAASAKVDAVTRKESLALERLKASKLAQADAAHGTTKAEQDRSESEKIMKILVLEMASRDRVLELEEAKKAAQEAQDAAKKVLEDSKQRRQRRRRRMRQRRCSR